MKNKTIQVMTKISTGEHYDGATHAVIEVTPDLVEFISRKIATAKLLAEDSVFEALVFSDYTAEFIDFTADQAAERCALAEDDFEDYMDGGEGIILPEEFVVVDDERANICPMSLHVSSTEFWWEGWDKYVGVNGHVETYRLSGNQLDEWNEHLGGPPLTRHGMLTWLGLRRKIEQMLCDSDTVTVLMPDGEFIGVKPEIQVATDKNEAAGVLDSGNRYLVCGTEEAE